jgi:hypothetical protein
MRWNPCVLTAALWFLVPSIGAQVMLNMNYERELRHAESLIAGSSVLDVAHHIHYDLKLYDRNGHESTATYDIYRAPLLCTRVEIKSGNYTFTHISSEREKKEWLRYSGERPLKVFDFQRAFDRPYSAIERLAQELHNIGQLQTDQLDGAPLLCANDHAGTAICFNPLLHLFAYAQMFNQTIMYDRWLPIGSHTVPGSIRIYEDKKLLVEATGTVEVVKKFPPGWMQLPAEPSMPDPDIAHPVVRRKPIDMTEAVYGNAEIAVSVDEKGHVKKADIVDSDEKKIEGLARKSAHGMVFVPQKENGQPTPFDTILYLEYYPW